MTTLNPLPEKGDYLEFEITHTCHGHMSMPSGQDLNFFEIPSGTIARIVEVKYEESIDAASSVVYCSAYIQVLAVGSNFYKNNAKENIELILKISLEHIRKCCKINKTAAKVLYG